MFRFVLKRIGVGLLLVFLVLTLIFGALHLVPGDPAVVLLTSSGSSAPSDQAVAHMRDLLGLDRPLGTQYVSFIGNAVTGDLGTSFVQGSSVSAEIASRFPRSLELIIAAAIIASLVGTFLGALAARAGGIIDTAVTAITSLAISVPVFVTGVLLILVVSLNLGWLPAGGYTSWSEDPIGHVKLLILPALTLALPFTANVARMARSSVMETQRRDWVRTAISLGLSRPTVFRRHVLRNSMTPVVTVIGLQFGKLLGSTVLVESVFNYPGLSSLLIEGVTKRDYPVVQGVVIVIAASFIAINIIVDIIYGFLDPRVAR